MARRGHHRNNYGGFLCKRQEKPLEYGGYVSKEDEAVFRVSLYDANMSKILAEAIANPTSKQNLVRPTPSQIARATGMLTPLDSRRSGSRPLTQMDNRLSSHRMYPQSRRVKTGNPFPAMNLE